MIVNKQASALAVEVRKAWGFSQKALAEKIHMLVIQMQRYRNGSG